MSIPVPLSVRLRTLVRDVHVTDQLTDLTFSSNSPGGYDTCTLSLRRPLTFTPGEVAVFGRLYVYAPTGIVWEGRLQDPGRTAGGDGPVYEVAAVGGQAHLQDRTAPYIILDQSLDRFELRRFSTEHAKAERRVDDTDGGTAALWLTAPRGTVWPDLSTCTMVYPHIRNAGQKLGAYNVSGDCGKSTTDIWRWQAVTRSPAGTGTVDRNVNFTTAGIAASQREVADSFPDGDDQLEFRFQQVATANQTADDDVWCIFANFFVTAKLISKAGVELGASYNYAVDRVTANEVVEDLLGRMLPELDGADAVVAAGVYQIDQLAYPDGVTPAAVLADLIALEPAYTYHIWESNPANGLFRFEWVTWPTTVRYEADVVDGFSAPSSGNTLFNKVRVRYRDKAGLTRSELRTQTVQTLTDAGVDRTHFMDLGDEVGSPAAAIRAGDEFLAEHASPVNAGRLVVTAPIVDLQAGRMVQPYEIRAGNLIRVRGVESYPDSLNPDGRDGRTVFKVASASYSAGDATATLELDTYAPSVARALAALMKRPPARRR